MLVQANYSTSAFADYPYYAVADNLSPVLWDYNTAEETNLPDMRRLEKYLFVSCISFGTVVVV